MPKRVRTGSDSDWVLTPLHTNMWKDTDIPLAVFFTFRCYGTWLHGDDRGSVDRIDDLPDHVREEFLRQSESDPDLDPLKVSFRLRVVSYDQLTEELDNVFGPNLLDYVEDDYVRSLANDIAGNGLRHPPVGGEGIHRKLAHHLLERDMPRFEIIQKEEDIDE